MRRGGGGGRPCVTRGCAPGPWAFHRGGAFDFWRPSRGALRAGRGTCERGWVWLGAVGRDGLAPPPAVPALAARRRVVPPPVCEAPSPRYCRSCFPVLLRCPVLPTGPSGLPGAWGGGEVSNYCAGGPRGAC